MTTLLLGDPTTALKEGEFLGGDSQVFAPGLDEPGHMTPDDLIRYAEELAGGVYGDMVHIYVKGDTIILGGLHGDDSDSEFQRRTVCGYVAHLLAVGLTNYAGDSGLDRSKPKVIDPKAVNSFMILTKHLKNI